MIYVDVLLPLKIDRPFTYSYDPARGKGENDKEDPEKDFKKDLKSPSLQNSPLSQDLPLSQNSSLSIGSLVEVSFRGKSVVGVVWRLLSSPPEASLLPKIKPLLQCYKVPPFKGSFLRLIEWVARYTLSPLGLVLKLSLSSGDFLKPLKKSVTFQPLSLDKGLQNPPSFSEEQKKAIDVLCCCVEASKFQTILLDGVTGSGKTEVYLEAVAKALSRKKQVLILVPEIGLTPQTLQRFEKRFGSSPYLWHSDLGPAERRRTWQGVLKGDISVIIGARSALFLPFTNLGLVIVDEEHEHSYKQEETILYQGRDMAIVRGHLENIPVILATATPSLETYVNAREGRYERVSLNERYGGATLPEMTLLDRRQEREKVKGVRWLAKGLITGIQETLERKEQVLLFLNRRGYAPLTLCGECGERLECPHCASWLVEHRSLEKLLCHHCGFEKKQPPSCPACHKEDSFVACGPGVERLEEEVQNLFPEARLVVMASDQGTVKERETRLKEIQQGKIDILIGTQMVAKGHHFPGLTLVGVIDADLGLSGGDLRASEKTYQLLHQVSGRAGRAQHKGHVLLQTFMPEHPVLGALISGDRNAFLEAERLSREAFEMPPYGRLAGLILSGTKEELVEKGAQHLGRYFRAFPELEVLGPTTAPLAKVRNRYRWRLLLKTSKDHRLQPFLRQMQKDITFPSTLRLHVDIDPYSFL